MSSLFIFDQYGRCIFERESNDNTLSLSLNIDSGIYTVRIQLESGKIEQKRLVIH